MRATEIQDGVNVVDCHLVGTTVLVQSDGIGAEVPRPGTGVQASALTTEPGWSSITLHVDASGTLHTDIQSGSPDLGALHTSAAGVAACQDGAYNLYLRPWNFDNAFRINRSTIPNGMRKKSTVRSLVRGMKAWPRQRNDCGFRDRIRVGVHFRGNGESVNSVTMRYGRAVCRNRGNNRKSIVGFGRLPASAGGTTLGATCRFFNGSFILGGDFKLNSRIRWTNYGRASGCRRKADVQSVATHEAGHWWGLDHVNNTTHRNLTMSMGVASAYVCNTIMRSLGKGDLRGMRAIYN